MKTDLDYVIEKLQSGAFVLTKISDVTKISITTLMRIRDGVTTNPNSLTVNTLKDYFMRVGE